MMYAVCGAAGVIAGILIAAAVLFAAFRRDKTTRDKKRRTSAETPVKRRLEFSKFIVALYAFACILWVTADYVLAFMYQQPINTQVTVTLTTTVVAALLGYYGKSAFEKANRNKYALDEDGVPYERDGGS